MATKALPVEITDIKRYFANIDLDVEESTTERSPPREWRREGPRRGWSINIPMLFFLT